MVTKKAKKQKLGRRLGGLTIKSLLAACAGAAVLTLGLVFGLLLVNSIPFLQAVPIQDFLFNSNWAPFSAVPSYGVLPLLAGTFLVSVVAACIAIPIGLGCTIYLSEISDPRVKKVLKPAIELLAGIPSVVYGLFAALVLSDWVMAVFQPDYRLNALNGALILAVMMIPIQVSISEEAMNSVPRNLREASYALGATKWETIRRTVLPAAMPGIIAAIVLAIGRAVGETMTVLMATGNASQFTFDILASVQTMTAALAIDIPEAAQGSEQYYALFTVGLLLFVITFVINMIADIILARYREAYA